MGSGRAAHLECHPAGCGSLEGPPWTGPPGENEAEVITWVTFDLADGIGYGFVRYTRRPNGELVFGEPEVLLIDLEATERAPGRTLLRAFLDDADSTP